MDIGGSLQTGVGIGLPALFLSMGWKLPFTNFFTALITGAVIGLVIGGIVMLVRKLMPEGVAVGGTSVMMGHRTLPGSVDCTGSYQLQCIRRSGRYHRLRYLL